MRSDHRVRGASRKPLSRHDSPFRPREHQRLEYLPACGLPPGPIANPGLSSIKRRCAPARTTPLPVFRGQGGWVGRTQFFGFAGAARGGGGGLINVPRTAKPNPVAIDVPWSGIRQHTLEELETSLCELAAAYAARPEHCAASVAMRRFAPKNAPGGHPEI